MVWNIKYKRSRHAVAVGGHALWRSLAENVSGSPIIILPMPITQKRRRERGYNQCELLLDEMKQLSSENENFLFEKDLLIRTHHAARQTLKDRADRVESAKGIFGVNGKALEKYLVANPEFKKMPIIVIDDVITTGSTTREAIDVLKRAGFEDVRAISIAH